MPPLWIVLFCLFFGFTMLACGIGFRFLETHRGHQLERLRQITSRARAAPEVRIMVNPDPLQLPQRNGLLRFGPLRRVQEYIYTAGIQWRVEAVLAAGLLLAAAGAFLGWLFHPFIYADLSSVLLALLLGSLPFLVVRHQRRTRLREFEQQFPEALDFIARSVQSGHAFSVSLELLASEASEPLRTEFSRVFRELSLGAEFETAMKSLVQRIPLLDVRFFVSTVLLQKDTGGNLAEMLTKLAFVIRERFQIRGHVRAASAHGRLTATVLGVMPFALALGLSIVTPQYLPSMVSEPFGRQLILTAIVFQILGYYFLRRIVNIKV